MQERRKNNGTSAAFLQLAARYFKKEKSTMKSSKSEKSGKYVSENKAPMVAIAAKVTEDEHARITQAAHLRGLTVSEYVRWCTLTQEWADMKARVDGADWKPR
jgi:hypothetical protein